MQRLRENWLIILSFVAVTIVAWLPVSWNHTVILIAFLLSLPFYNAFIAVSVALLVLPFTRLFTSYAGESKQTMWWALDIMLCTLLISHGLKYVLHLPRPSGSPSGAISGHTAFAFGLSYLIAKTFPRLGPYWFAFAVAVGWSRVQTEAHYPYQVPLGAILGLFIAWAVSTLTNGVLVPRYFRRRQNKKKIPEKSNQQSESVENAVKI